MAFLDSQGLLILVTQLKTWVTNKLNKKVDKEELSAIIGDINTILDEINGEEV